MVAVALRLLRLKLQENAADTALTGAAENAADVAAIAAVTWFGDHHIQLQPHRLP